MASGRIYLIGFMGAGKTTVGRIVAEKLGWVFLDLDREIESGEGQPISVMFRTKGEPHFRKLEHTYLRALSVREHAVVALGGGTFTDPENRRIVDQSGVSVWLDASLSQVFRRIRSDGTRPKFKTKHQLAKLYEARIPSYRKAKLRIRNDDAVPEVVAEQLIRSVVGT